MPDRRVTWYLPTGSGKRWPGDYERGRPGWSDVVDIPGLPSSATVLDLAAGTGKLTRLVIAAYERELAVEPHEMRSGAFKSSFGQAFNPFRGLTH